MRHLLTGLGTALFLAACGGGGSDDGGGNTPPVVQKPTAVANADQSRVPIGTLVTLDGSGSTTPNNGAITYQWSLPGKPGGSTAELSSSTDAKPGFTPDLPGEYIAALIVNDGTASSDSTRVTITATNPNPLAVISPETQGVLLGTTITLDGSNSNPPTGVDKSELRYQWSLTERPDGDSAELQGTDTATASFLASQVGIYKARLKVSHGERSSEAEATITVNTSNSAPVISIDLPEGTEHDLNGSPIVKAVRGKALVLDGSGSSDPDGDALNYRWSFPSALANGGVSIPYGANPSMRNANSAMAEFVPDAAGTYHIDFTVYDASVAATQRVIVKVTRPEGAANTPPVAVIGSGNPIEFEYGGYVFPAATLSYDVDGDPLTYQWVWWNTATPNDKQPGGTLWAANMGKDLPVGTYEVELIVNDGQESSAPVREKVTIKIGANTAPPNPSTKVDIARVMVSETITFDGSGSTDRNGDQIAYQWTLVDRPDGSNAVLQNATSALASVVADRPGVYAARLQVTDSRGATNYASPYDTVSAFAKAKNNPPVVAYFSPFGAGNSKPATDQPVILNDSGSTAYGSTVWLRAFDPDQDSPLYFIITPIQQPGSDIQPRSNSTSPGTLVEASLGTIKTPGDYEIEALVSDGVANSEPLRQSFSVVNRADFTSLLLERASTPTRHDASGPGGNPPSYSQLFFPLVVHQGFLPEGSLLTTFWYRLTAFDRDYTITDLVTSSTDNSLLPSFRGLQNGQIIRKGQTVEFVWHRPLLPNEAELPQKLREIASQFGSHSNEYKNEVTRQQKILSDYQFTGTFRIAEKENYTFRIGHFAQD
jgi:hypothetical protein